MEKKLPKGWVETELSSILKLKNGYAFKSTEYKEEGVPVIRISDIKDGAIKTDKAICVNEFERAKDFIIEKGDILIAMSGATTGKYGIYESDDLAYQNQRVGNLKLHSDKNNNKRFVYYLLGNLKKEIEEKAYGGAQPNISAKLIEEIKIPLPPLTEQERIVAKLDTLFAHLETAKAGLEKIPVLLKQFRQAVLTQAVTGKLTEEWREGKELGEWREEKLKNFSETRLGKMLDKNKNIGVPKRYLGNINVRWFQFDIENLNDLLIFEEEAKKFELKKNDILVCEGGEPGRAAIWNFENSDIIYQKALHRVRLNNEVLPEYFLYNLKNDCERGTINYLFTGTTIKHLTGKQFANYCILIPSIEEQTEIVRRVEALFAKADAIEEKYKQLKEKIENLPQAVLAKAFRGEV
jgi:type I restriction enzyme S subunit